MAEAKPTYYAKGGSVRKASVHTRNDDGSTSMTLDFPVCSMTSIVGDDAAETLATLMNRGELLGSAAAQDLLAERRRQIEQEGWSPEHDDGHALGELGLAAALYALPYDATVGGEKLLKQDDFIGLHMTLDISCGWDMKAEPDRRRRLIKAGALIIAEIERLDRASAIKLEARP